MFPLLRRRREARVLNVSTVIQELMNDSGLQAAQEGQRLWARFREWWNAIVALIAVSLHSDMIVLSYPELVASLWPSVRSLSESCVWWCWR